MKWMRVFLSSILLISATQAFAADDMVTRAMKSYEKRHYNEAARTLRAEGASIEQGKKGNGRPCPRNDLFQECGASSRILSDGGCDIGGLPEEALDSPGSGSKPLRGPLFRRSAGGVGQSRCGSDSSEEILMERECRGPVPGDRQGPELDSAITGAINPRRQPNSGKGPIPLTPK